MADSLPGTTRRVQLSGSRLWGIVDVAKAKPCREPVEANAATTFVIDCILQTLLPLPKTERSTGFLGVAGECQFLRTQFPENLLSSIAGHVELMVKTLLANQGESPVSFSGENYKIDLVILPSRDSVRDWIGEQSRLPEKDQTSPSQGTQTAANLIAAALKNLPADYEGRYRVLKEFQDQVRAEVALLLQPVLRQQANLMPVETYAEKQQISTWVNAQLRELGLAIRCPQTGRPAILVADLRDAETQSSRFRYAIRDAQGKATKTISSKQLPELELMVDEPRQESRAKGPSAGHLPGQ